MLKNPGIGYIRFTGRRGSNTKTKRCEGWGFPSPGEGGREGSGEGSGVRVRAGPLTGRRGRKTATREALFPPLPVREGGGDGRGGQGGEGPGWGPRPG